MAVIYVVFAVLFVSQSDQARAQTQDVCAPEMARVTSAQGEVKIRWSETEAWRDAGLDDVLCMGTAIRVGSFSRAALVFADDSTLRLDQDTTLTLRAREQERRTWLEMLTGAIHFFSHRPQSLGVETPYVNAAAEGTEFLIRLGEDRAHILMYEGILQARNPFGDIRLGPNDAALIRAGERPIPEIVVRPRDAVAWALHYPPVLSDLADGGETGVDSMPVRNALDWVRAGNFRFALRSLDKVPADQRDARNETLRAGILLNVGRIEEAEAAIQRALARDPDASDAYAQRSIIHVVRNERAQARRDADRAVALAPASSTALIAQSYARQASFDLEGARESLRAAVQKNPNDALAFARLAEIELSFADYDRANDAADQAVRLAPNLARTQTVRGFAHLAEIDTGAARTSFTKAIQLYSADPLPHLGQGLAKIRDGFLEDGRRDLEIAASLDPNNALIRSYLGKAYFEEKRGPRDATQFEIAKKLDPNDPTPYLYDAIRKQSENRPVEALRDLEKAIKLNDNRAIYSSRLALDTDQAIRQARLARTYNSLGFQELGLVEAAKSLRQDPTNFSARRFLSDAYAALPRHEIARASELLQAQLLQPITINPLQPSLALSDLIVRSGIGPSESRFNEFAPLFERNQTRITVAGVAGNNGFLGDELLGSVLWDRFSLSAGQFYSNTDGFRENAEIENRIYSLFAQVAAAKNLGIQAEYIKRMSDLGDIELNFDPLDFSLDDRRKVDQELIRIGIRYDISPNSTLLTSLLYNERTEDAFFLPFPSLENEFVSNEDGYQSEISYLLNTEVTDIIAGIGRYKIDVEEDDIFNGTPIFQDDFTSFHNNAYIYASTQFWDKFWINYGLSYDNFDEGRFRIREWNPKVGIDWSIREFLHLRAARVETVKRSLIADQTLEPTNVSGFNQFFDDPNGTLSTRYGVMLDADIGPEVFGGIGASKRELEVPFIDDQSGGTGRIEREEEEYKIYIYWTPSVRWSVGSTIKFERFRFNGDTGLTPRRIDTQKYPLELRYHSPSGLFAGIRGTYVRQEFKSESNQVGRDDFFVLDLSLGVRLPKRLGAFSFEVSNILDEQFKFQDDNFRTQRDRLSEFLPDRSVVARATFTF